MDVVRHDDPRPQLVSDAVKQPQGVRDQRGNLRLPEMRFAATLIEVGFKFCPALPVVFDLPEMFPFGTERFRKAVGEAECHELREPWLIAMRQITALVPTAEALFGFTGTWRTRSVSLV